VIVGEEEIDTKYIKLKVINVILEPAYDRAAALEENKLKNFTNKS
jgi:hypothetical protein